MMQMEITISDEDRQLLLTHLPDLPGPVRARLMFAVTGKDSVSLVLDEDHFETLMDGLNVACGVAVRASVRDKLEDLFGRLIHQAPLDPDPFAKIAEDTPVAGPKAEIQAALREMEFADLDDVNRKLSEITDRYNRAPQAELGGLSPLQVKNLLYNEIGSPESGITFDTTLPMEAFRESEIFLNAHLVMEMLEEEDGTKATARGNLNRKFVRQFADRAVLLEGFFDALRDYRKTWDEDDAVPLVVLRHVLQFAGLIRRYKGKFVLTKKGRQHMRPEEAGALYGLLFTTLFRGFNLGYFDGCPEYPGVQHTIAYSFYVLSQRVGDWTCIQELSEELFLAPVAAEFLIRPYSGESDARLIAETRILKPLERFGLVELQAEEERPSWRVLQKVRKTPLFDAWFQVHIDQTHEKA